jgi:hypothetical protein
VAVAGLEPVLAVAMVVEAHPALEDIDEEEVERPHDRIAARVGQSLFVWRSYKEERPAREAACTMAPGWIVPISSIRPAQGGQRRTTTARYGPSGDPS